MVAGFAAAAPNRTLLEFATRRFDRCPRRQLIDIGCGAGRNAIPLADLGWRVTGVDLSQPMLAAASRRHVLKQFLPLLAPMDALPIGSGTADMVVAHGIWNLARTGREFRHAVAEAARVAAAGASLFVFTFSRTTLSASAEPVAGETFVFTEFSGSPQCFLTRAQLIDELDAAGFEPDPEWPVRELNAPLAHSLRARGPVIFEGGFRRRTEP